MMSTTLNGGGFSSMYYGVSFLSDGGYRCYMNYLESDEE